jgi:hypothetical protein
MVWAYYDESGEYDAAGKLLNMSMGGVVAPVAKWNGFCDRWNAALAGEGLAGKAFHMTDFEAWLTPFDFKLPNGDRDKEKHNRLLNTLLDIALDHVECFAGFAEGNKISEDAGRAHFLAIEGCTLAAVTHAVHDLWERYGEPINLVFGKNPHFSATKMMEYVDLYDWGEGRGRIKTAAVGNPEDFPPMQVADILAFEMGKEQRAGRARRYPFAHILEGCIKRDIPMTLKWGPFTRLSDRKALAKGRGQL